MNKNILTQMLSLALLVSVAPSFATQGNFVDAQEEVAPTWAESIKGRAGSALNSAELFASARWANVRSVSSKAKNAVVATPSVVKAGAGKAASAVSYVVRPNDGSDLDSFKSDKDTRFAKASNAVIAKAQAYPRTYKYGVNGAKYGAMAAAATAVAYKLYHSPKVRDKALSLQEAAIVKYVQLKSYIASLRS